MRSSRLSTDFQGRDRLERTRGKGLEGKELEVSFRCEGKDSTIAEAMNQAIQQESLWGGTTSQVKQITLHPYDRTQLLVHLTSSSFYDQEAIEKEKIASDVWSRLGFTVRQGLLR